MKKADKLSIPAVESDSESGKRLDRLSNTTPTQLPLVDGKPIMEIIIELSANAGITSAHSITNITELQSGLTNKTFSFDISDKKYIIRIPDHISNTIINRQAEYENLTAIKKLNISPKLIYFSQSNGIKIEEFLENSVELDPAAVIKRFAEISQLLNNFHSKNIKVSNRFELREKLALFESMIEHKQKTLMPKSYPEIRDKVLALYEKRVLPNFKHLCHNDLQCSNILAYNGKIILIDWEYSGINDPMSDFASLINECEIDLEDAIRELNFSNHENERIRISMLTQNLLWSTWAQVKIFNGEDLHEYFNLKYAKLTEMVKHI